MTFSRRAIGMAALLTVGGLTLSACSGGATASSDDQASATTATAAADFDPDKQYEIVFESYNLGNATWEPTILGLIEEFEQQYPNVDVIPQALGADSTAAGGTAGSVQRQVLANNPPDVVQMTFDTLDFAVENLSAQPLDVLYGRDAVDSHFEAGIPMHESVRDFGVLGDHIYGVPYVLSTPMFFYNATGLAEAGIDAPDLTTWDSVAEVARAVTEKTGKPSLSVSCLDPVGEWCLQSMIRSNGGRVLSEDRSTVGFGSDETVEVIAQMQGLYEDGVLENADFTTQSESFAAGEVLMHVNSASMQASFEQGAEGGGWTLEAAGIPAFDGSPVVPTSSGSALMVFSQDADKQAAAFELLKFMTSETAYENIAPLGYLPLRTGLIEEGNTLSEWAASNRLLAPNLEQLESIEPWVAYPGESYVQIGSLLMDAVNESVYQGADPREALSVAASRAQDLVDR